MNQAVIESNAITDVAAYMQELGRKARKASRALARALSGDMSGALEDFRYAVENWQSSEEQKQLRVEIIEALEAGQDPFTAEMVDKLQ